MKKNYLKSTLLVLLFCCLVVGFSFANFNCYLLDKQISVTSAELDGLKPSYPVKLNQQFVDGEQVNLQYKVFNIPIKNINCQIKNSQYVYLGGHPLGIKVKSDGMIITNVMSVSSPNGMVSPCGDAGIKVGDILCLVNGKKIECIEDFQSAILLKDVVSIKVLRNGQYLDFDVVPIVDEKLGVRKLGLWLKGEVNGIGTLTYVQQNGRYGALGHCIQDESGHIIDNLKGGIYNAKIYDVVKGERGKAGELSGSFASNIPQIGSVDKNIEFGIFGNYSAKPTGQQIEVATRNLVKPGKAFIYTTINGANPQKYEIEIIKASTQTEAKSCGMVIRVTDKALLATAGGIVQGMSGSPIIQNNRLIGAVTHVFINDPTKGYATYVDWMINN
ncbi:MAG: SpoIVB peptidase [Clostridia bacterium]